MEPRPDLPFVAQIDDLDAPSDVLELQFLAPFVDGRHTHSRARKLNRVRTAAPLVPEGTTRVRRAVESWRTIVLAEGDGWNLKVERQPDASATLTATGTDEAVVDRVLSEASSGAERPAPPPEEAIPVTFWHRGGNGPRRSVRTLDIRTWADIEGNYAARVRQEIGRLLDLEATAVTGGGGLLLLHGPPGTGKTSLIRALGYAWREWCRLECVLDPERLLGDAAYLAPVLLGHDDEDDEDGEESDDDAPSGRWRLLVLEDWDEVIGPDARLGAGQALSRLLNLADGLLGQGRRVLVCITTNEDVSRFHPAIIRPGRCLARLAIDRLDPEEAAAWSGEPASAWPDGASLAELFAARRGGRLAPVDVARTRLGFAPALRH